MELSGRTKLHAKLRRQVGEEDKRGVGKFLYAGTREPFVMISNLPYFIHCTLTLELQDDVFLRLLFACLLEFVGVSSAVYRELYTHYHL